MSSFRAWLSQDELLQNMLKDVSWALVLSAGLTAGLAWFVPTTIFGTWLVLAAALLGTVAVWYLWITAPGDYVRHVAIGIAMHHNLLSPKVWWAAINRI